MGLRCPIDHKRTSQDKRRTDLHSSECGGLPVRHAVALRIRSLASTKPSGSWPRQGRGSEEQAEGFWPNVEGKPWRDLKREAGTPEEPKQTHPERGSTGVSWCRTQLSLGGCVRGLCGKGSWECSVLCVPALQPARPDALLMRQPSLPVLGYLICSYNLDFKYHMNNSENYFTVVR